MFEIFRIKGFLAFISVIFINAFIDLGHKIVIQNAIFKSFDGSMQVMMMAIVNGLLLLPFVAFFSPSGFVSDKYPKNKVLRLSLLFCILATILITVMYAKGWFWGAFVMTFFLAMQSAFLSPAKFGYIKELVGKENIAMANAYVQAVTIVAILKGIFVFSILFERLLPKSNMSLDLIISNMMPVGFILVGLACIQYLISFAMPTKKKTETNLVFEFPRYFKGRYLKSNLAEMRQSSVIWLSAIGLMVFWSVNQVVLATFGSYLKEVAGVTNTIVAQGLLALGGVGIIIGSIYAGRISKSYIEVGLIPVAAIGLAGGLFFLPQAQSVWLLGALFVMYGLFGGLFIVPLESLIQFNVRSDDSGQVLAGKNFVANVGMLFFLVLTIGLTQLNFSSTSILNLMCIVAVAGAVYTLFKLPQSFIKYLIRFVLSQAYLLNVIGLKNLPSTGGVLLLGNHTSWVDWAFLQMASPRPLRFVMERSIYEKRYLRWFLNFFGVVPISSSKSKEALKQVSKLLEAGEVVVIFPEGAISRNGQLGKFHKGFEAVENTSDFQIIPFYLCGLWGSKYSFSTDTYRKSSRLKRLREIIVCFGESMPATSKATDVKAEVSRLSIYAWQRYTSTMESIPRQWINAVKSQPREKSVVDYDGRALSNTMLLTGTLLIKDVIKKHSISQQNIGVILPTGLGGIIANMAILLLGKTVVNMNYTTSPEIIDKCRQKADIKTIVTSRLFIKKLAQKGFDLEGVLSNVNVIYLEDYRQQPLHKKLIKLMMVTLLPISLLKRLVCAKSSLSDTAVILFSSGSEGDPKGVQLSHRNIVSNIKQIFTVVNPQDSDVVMNSLPMFHAFGLTVATFMPLLERLKMVCIPDPTDGYLLGKLCFSNKGTVLFGTSTFLRLYARNKKLHADMLKSIRIVVAGAEKLSDDVRQAFKEKFGLNIYEGYGTTETTPVASVNIPDMLIPESWNVQVGGKIGSVGLPLPGSTFMIVEPETLTPLPVGEEGLILIGGTQIMKGYLNDAKKTNDAIVEMDGIRWYLSGDKGRLDEDGFLTIVDRYSRFAKIGGEMVSLTSVELEVSKLFSDDFECIAVNLPDAKKGEKIVLLYSADITTEELKGRVFDSELNALMYPTSYVKVDEIPKLGSGKQDFNRAKGVALDFLGE